MPFFTGLSPEQSINAYVVDKGSARFYNTTYPRERITMRQSLFVVCLILILGVTTPVNAQLRTDATTENATVRLYDFGETGFSLNRYFSPEHFRMSHSVEFSSGSFGGTGSSLAMYTNSLMWQFSQKLAARVDVAFAYSPFSDERLQGITGGNNGRVFIRNADLVYKPSENSRLQLSFRQSPYGMYASPYGNRGYGNRGYGYRPYYGGSSFQATYSSSDRNLFWNDRIR